jgi:hypothetical protein
MNTSLNIFEVEFSEEQNIEVLKLAIIKQCCTDKTGIITLSIKQAINHEEKQLLKDLSNTSHADFWCMEEKGSCGVIC